tara:strand:- start:3944 stop:4531 length:588 start_codon:yes stop_codon:yes gene_type:complete
MEAGKLAEMRDEDYEAEYQAALDAYIKDSPGLMPDEYEAAEIEMPEVEPADEQEANRQLRALRYFRAKVDAIAEEMDPEIEIVERELHRLKELKASKLKPAERQAAWYEMNLTAAARNLLPRDKGGQLKLAHGTLKVTRAWGVHFSTTDEETDFCTTYAASELVTRTPNGRALIKAREDFPEIVKKGESFKVITP